MNELPQREDFLEHLNTKFRVFFSPERATEVDLIEVSEPRRRGNYEAFALVLLAPNEAPPVQGFYRTEHDALGAMDLFLGPFDRSEKGIYFEVLFNRPVSAVQGD